METVARVRQNIEAVVDATRKAGDEQLAVVQRVRARAARAAVAATPAKRRSAAQRFRVVSAPRSERASHWPAALAQDLARERKARLDAEAVLADTTRARACSAFGFALPLTPAAFALPCTRHTLRCGSTRRLCFPSRASCRRPCRRCWMKSRRRTLSSQSSSPTTGLHFGASPNRCAARRKPRRRALLTPVRPQMGDSGRPTYEGLKQKVQEKDKQLEEALAIIKELTEALQGVRARSAMPSFRVFFRPEATHGCRKLRRLPLPAPRWCAHRAATVPHRQLSRSLQRSATATIRNLTTCVPAAVRAHVYDANARLQEPAAALAPAPAMFWVTTSGNGGGLLGKLLGAK